MAGKKKIEEPKKAGRPEMEITPEIWKEVCDRVAAGESIRKVLQSDKKRFPQWDRFRKEKDRNEPFNAQYVKAIQDKGEMEVCDIDEVCDDLKAGKIDAASANVIIQAKKWKAAKFYPKMYGEKVDVTTGGEKLPNPQPVAFISVDKLTDEQLEKYIQANAGGNDESI
jgi:hypothetical protein